MEVPFIYGKLAGDAEFTNRTADVRLLLQNFEAGINTILISPRRWGKSSLVTHTASVLRRRNKQLRVCQIDLFSVRSEEEFYAMYSSAVLSACSSKLDEAREIASRFLSKFIPRISVSADPNSEISVGLDWKEVKKDPADILNLPESIAKNKRMKIVVCMDEFQNLGTFQDPIGFQKKLRSAMQRHKNVTYCLYGSKRHMMMDVFTNPSMPFYKFGHLIFLQKLSADDLTAFIQKRFKETGKQIAQGDAMLITELCECHPYYAQQLAQQVWLQTARKANKHIVLNSHERICDQLSLLFHSITDGLSATQVNFLHALCNKETAFSSKDVVEQYRLGTSGNVMKIKKALEDREIIDLIEKDISILDPYYAHWLKTRYFK